MSLVRADITNSSCCLYWATITTSIKAGSGAAQQHELSTEYAVLERVSWGWFPSDALINISESCSNTGKQDGIEQLKGFAGMSSWGPRRPQSHSLHVPHGCRSYLHSGQSTFSSLLQHCAGQTEKKNRLRHDVAVCPTVQTPTELLLSAATRLVHVINTGSGWAL